MPMHFESLLLQTVIVYLRWMLIESESMAILTMRLLKSWSADPVAKLNKFLIMCLLVYNGSKIVFTNFVKLNAFL